MPQAGATTGLIEIQRQGRKGTHQVRTLTRSLNSKVGAQLRCLTVRVHNRKNGGSISAA
jgi:hypothetical protein